MNTPEWFPYKYITLMEIARTIKKKTYNCYVQIATLLLKILEVGTKQQQMEEVNILVREKEN